MAATDSAFKAAKRLRRELTLPEVLLWRQLRRAPVKFRRQHPLGPYVLDFYCAAAKLGIEVDGIAHDMGERPERDAARDTAILALGVRIVRIPAKEVLCDPAGVAAGLLALATPPPPR